MSKKNPDLDKILLDIVKEMQPISAEVIWMEIGEDSDIESTLSQVEVVKRLDGMVKKRILARVKLENGGVGYGMVGK